MRIGIDITSLYDQYKDRGLGTYTIQLVSRLIQNPDFTWVIFGFEDSKQAFKNLGINGSKNVEFISLGGVTSSSIKNILFFRRIFLPKIKTANLDLFFAPHFERGLPIGKVRTIVMMHDLIPFITNSYSQKSPIHNTIKGLFYRHNLRKALKADAVLTNSDFSKNELVDKGNFDPQKVFRTYLGIKDSMKIETITTDDRIIRRTLMMYKITKPYIFYFGGLETNKNVHSVIDTFALLTKKYPDLKLVIGGKSFKLGWDSRALPQTRPAKDLLAYITNQNIKHKVIFTGSIDERHLPIIMSNSKAYINLSTYEGFGLAVTEALAAGTLVVAADSSCYPEVLSGAASLVPADKPQEIATTIEQLLESPKQGKELQKKGLSIAKTYNWEQTTEDTLKYLKQTATKFQPLKIGYVIPHFYPFKGGAENNAYELARRMAKSGHEVKVFTSNDRLASLAETEVVNNMTIIRAKRLNNSYYLGFYPKLFTNLLKTKLDIIHVHGFGFIWHDFCLIVKKLISPKTVFINTPHGPFMAHGQYSAPLKVMKFIYTFFQSLFLNKLYSKIISVNPKQDQWITKYRIKKDKISLLSNGINKELLEKMPVTEIKKIYNLDKKFTISFIGRFEEYKGLQNIIESIAKLKPDHKVKLVAMGIGGNYLDELKLLVSKYNLEEEVEILINCDYTTRDQILQASDLFVLPSKWEAFGISILEAMAKKCAIITTKTEGGEFLIEEKKNGFLFDYGDIDTLTKHIQTLLKDKELLAKIQNNNYNKAQNYLWSHIIKGYKDLVTQLYKNAKN